MDLAQVKLIHFVGIKGVGMTATALCLEDFGMSITGSDVPENFITQKVLEERGIKVYEGFKAQNIPQNTDLVVFTGAHNGSSNVEVLSAKERGIPCITQAEAVGLLMYDKKGISVCGVGGKTTTSAMLATIFSSADKKPSYLVGVGEINPIGVPGKYDTGEHFIAEADEYAMDPKTDHTPRFMFQNPEMIVCTNLVHDHPDIYSTFEDTIKAFRKFFEKLPEDGVLVYNRDYPMLEQLATSLNKRMISFGMDPESDYRLLETKVADQTQIVRYLKNDHEYEFTLSVPGEYNAKNALAALAVCEAHGINIEAIKDGLKKFLGTSRRFESRGNYNGITLVDDYAHHPIEISSVLLASRIWFRGRRVISIFQPHTYSRTKELFEEFAGSFQNTDEVIITDIFASARESFDPSITSQMLVEEIKQKRSAHYIPYDNLVEYIQKEAKPGDVVLTIGAGDIYKVHDRLTKSA